MSSKVNNYPFGTTLDWTQNGSTAFLDLPPGSVVLHAELIWSARYDSGGVVDLPLINSTAVNFTTPDSTVHPALPKPEVGFPGGTGQQTVEKDWYTRTQDVTALVAADVASFVASQPNDFYSETYIVGGVPGILPPPADNSYYAGWCLIVAFENENMNTNQLTITTAFEFSNDNVSPALELSGFMTPTSGNVSGYVFLSAFEADSQNSSGSLDSYLLGPGNTNPPTTALSGINNPVNNFFGSQVNTLLPYTTDVNTGKLVQTGSGQLDTRGSFGLVNHDPFIPQPVSGARQGTDITSIDISSQLVNGQTELYTKSETGGENLVVSSISLQIQQNAPIIVATKAASDITVGAGDTVTFTTNFENVGQEEATDLIFFDVLPAGLTFNSGTFNLSINGGAPINIPINASDLITGVDLSPFVPQLAIGDDITITFDITVGIVSTTYDNTAQINYASPTLLLDFTAQTNVVTIEVKPAPPPPEDFEGCIEKCEFLNKDVYHLIATWTAPVSPSINIVEYRIYQNAVLVETIPADSELIFEECSCSRDAFSGYEIASVSDFDVESSRVELKIIKG